MLAISNFEIKTLPDGSAEMIYLGKNNDYYIREEGRYYSVSVCSNKHCLAVEFDKYACSGLDTAMQTIEELENAKE